MVSPERSITFAVCMDGPKCSQRYLDDFERRKSERGPANQGTGNLCEDLRKIAKEMGIDIEVSGENCLDHCPIPGERSSVIGPDGKIHRVYFDDIPAMLKNFE